MHEEGRGDKHKDHVVAAIQEFLVSQDPNVDESIVDYWYVLLSSDDIDTNTLVNELLPPFLPSSVAGLEWFVLDIRAMIKQGEIMDEVEKESSPEKVTLLPSDKTADGLIKAMQQQCVVLTEPVEEDTCNVEDTSAIVVDEEALDFLQAIVPDMPSNVVHYVFTQKCHGNKENACQVLMETPLNVLLASKKKFDSAREKNSARLAEEACREKLLKSETLARYGDRPIKGGELNNVTSKKKKNSSDEKKIRYYNGQVVSRKGEKYLPAPSKEEWDGGSRGKVKSKGKRGKGWTE